MVVTDRFHCIMKPHQQKYRSLPSQRARNAMTSGFTLHRANNKEWVSMSGRHHACGSCDVTVITLPMHVVIKTNAEAVITAMVLTNPPLAVTTGTVCQNTVIVDIHTKIHRNSATASGLHQLQHNASLVTVTSQERHGVSNQRLLQCWLVRFTDNIMSSSNGNICRVTSSLWGESTGDHWISLAKASDAEPWCFLWSAGQRRRWLRRHSAHYDATVMKQYQNSVLMALHYGNLWATRNRTCNAKSISCFHGILRNLPVCFQACVE